MRACDVQADNGEGQFYLNSRHSGQIQCYLLKKNLESKNMLIP